MNTVTRSLLIGLAAGIVTFFVAGLVDKKKPARRYTLDYTLRLEPMDSSSALKVVAEAEAVLRRRLEKSGHPFKATSYPRQADNSVVLDVTVKDVTDMSSMRSLVSAQGRLQLWDMYTLPEIQNFYAIANEVADSISPVLPPKAPEKPKRDSSLSPEVAQLLDSMEVTATETTRATSGITRFIDPSTAYESNLGSVKIKDTAELGKILRSDKVVSAMPRGAKFRYGVQPGKKGLLDLYVIETNGVDNAPLQNKHIISAKQDYDQATANPTVFVQFSATGARIFAELTEKSAQNRTPIAIVVDDLVYSAPIAIDRIEGGSCVISGNFTVEEAEAVAGIIRAPALPARLTIINSRVTSQKSILNTRHILVALLALGVASVLSWFIFNALKST